MRCLDDIERRYDGPWPAAAARGLDPGAPARRAAAEVRLFQRLAAESARAAATRRRPLAAVTARDDARLASHGRALATYRALALAWHLNSGTPY